MIRASTFVCGVVALTGFSGVEALAANLLALNNVKQTHPVHTSACQDSMRKDIIGIPLNGVPMMLFDAKVSTSNYQVMSSEALVTILAPRQRSTTSWAEQSSWISHGIWACDDSQVESEAIIADNATR